MNHEALQMVIGMALTDQGLMSALITDRPRAIATLPLSEEEAGVLLTMPARSFQDLSKKLDSWIGRKTRTAHPVVAAVGVNDWF